ncbi:helix-turn-helix domain-containing protein [Streptomyces sp. NPDC052092]|uniref:helix-turn-helix domain-containing protein n=1 Tax=Streptomyces sp. NPDC052092 TaxID=3365685 RepID=UPI0037D45C1E
MPREFLAQGVQGAVNHSHDAGRFTECVGAPAVEHLAAWRLRAAAPALRTGNQTIAAIAARWGYSPESSFSHAFKRSAGVSPSTTGCSTEARRSKSRGSLSQPTISRPWDPGLPWSERRRPRDASFQSFASRSISRASSAGMERKEECPESRW